MAPEPNRAAAGLMGSGPLRWLGRYGAHPEPGAALANMVALLVASSQPLYPLYILWSAGAPAWPGFVTYLSTPFFCLVPALARRDPSWGRALLVATGIGNTLVCCKAFGVASGVEAFFFPCILLALVLFGPGERLLGIAFAGVALGALLVMHDRWGEPLHLYEPAAYAGFARLNAMSAATLTAVIGWRLAAPLAAAEKEAG